MKQKKLVSIVAGLLALLMILGLILSIIPTKAFAASSSSVKSEISDLEKEAEEIKEAKEALAQQQAENAEEQQNLVGRKMEIDQEIKLIHQEIDNINAQIKTYNQMISDKQKELDAAKVRQKDLNVHYQARIRAMEENGDVSYWAVLFRSSSFSEFLGNMSMISDIARADQRMMDELREAANAIEVAQNELTEEKASLEAQRTALDESQAELDARSAEATELLDELNYKARDMAGTFVEYEAKEDSLANEIAQKELEYTEALKKEEEERRKAEEEEKRREEEEKRKEEEEKENAENNNNETSGNDTESGDSGSGDSGNSGNEGGGSSSSSGWAYPLPYQAPITCPYGWRTHPITGNQSFHSGVDLGADSGTPIYAVRSGYVTTATYSDVYGNYVTVNHGDGYSSLSAHMTYYVVSSGEYVEQGQIIGYVGSTGWSTGPHLHLTIYYNGEHVNPMDYI